MIRNTLQLGLIVSAILASSCAPSGGSGDPAAAEAAIRALDEQWAATAAKHDVGGTVAFYADDAVVLAGNAPIATDRNSIRSSWADLLGAVTDISWKVTKVEVAKSADLGYLYGTYQLTTKDPKGGPGAKDIGKIVEIWKKQPDGKWKCIVDTYNSDLPLPAATAAEPKK